VNIAIAGGTGFLGSHIARALVDGGHALTLMSRAPERAASIPWLASARRMKVDVTDAISARGALDGQDGVVQAVQFPNHPIEVPRRGLTYDRFDRQGTENMVAEAVRAGVPRFFYLSGAGADPNSDKPWYRAKGRAEEAVRSSGLSWAILRPSWAYGPGDRALNRFAAIARYSPVIPRVGVAPQRVQPVSSEDIALAVRRIFERDAAWGKTFEIGGDVMTMDDILRTMLDVIGKRRLIVPIPKRLAKLGAAPLALLPSPFMTPAGIEFMVEEGLVDTTLVREILEVHPVSLREGLSRYLAR